MNSLNLPGTKKEKSVALILFIFLWTYLWVRAALVPFSHDEAATFFHYVYVERFIPFVNAHWYANNHVLNSVLAFFSYKLFGASELSLRLPNLLFFPVFFLFSYKLSHEIKNGIWRWLFLIILCFAHYFVEFFALCRGYGIAMASLTASVYYLMRVVKTNETKHYVYCLLFAATASLANLTLINSTALIAFLLIVNTVYQFRKTELKGSLKKFIAIVFLGIAPLIFLARFAIELQKRGLLDVGTHDGFWKVTMLSNTKVFTDSDNPVIGYYVAFIFALSCFFFIRIFIKKPSVEFFHNSRFVLFYLLIGNLFITLFLGTLFNVNYPEDRAAMYFFPLLVSSFCFLADDVSVDINPKIIGVAASPMLLLVVHFFFNLNMAYPMFWKDLRIPYSFCDKIEQYAVPGKLPPTIMGYHMRGFCWTFMNFKRGILTTQFQSMGYPYVKADYQLVHIEDRPDWLQEYDSLDYDPYSDIWLLKRKNPVSLTLAAEIKGSTTNGETTAEYFNFYEATIDSLKNKTLLITLDMSITSHEARPFMGQMVASVSDKDNKTLRYEYISLSFFKNKWNGKPHNFLYSMVLYELPPESDRMVIYFWDLHGMNYSIKDADCRIEVMN